MGNPFEELQKKINAMCTELFEKYSREIRSGVRQTERGTHPDIIRELDALKDRFTEQVTHAEVNKKYNTRRIMDRFKVDKQILENKHRFILSEAQNALLFELDCKRTKLAEELARYGMHKELPTIPINERRIEEHDDPVGLVTKAKEAYDAAHAEEEKVEKEEAAVAPAENEQDALGLPLDPEAEMAESTEKEPAVEEADDVDMGEEATEEEHKEEEEQKDVVPKTEPEAEAEEEEAAAVPEPEAEPDAEPVAEPEAEAEEEADAEM